MMSILHQAPWVKNDRYRLILQCQSKRPELRRWLYDEGFRINRETLAKDGKFVYSVMEVTYAPGLVLTPAQTYLSPALLEDNHPLLGEYYARVIHGVRLTVDGMKRSGSDELTELEAILQNLEELEDTINGNCN